MGDRWRVALFLAAAMLCGCQTTSKQTTSGPRLQDEKPPERTARRNDSAPPRADACADHLHELSGLILQYYALNGQLPEQVTRLPFKDLDRASELLRCPTSGRAYAYRPSGIPITEPAKGYLVLYDSQPTHDNARWGVLLVPGEGDDSPLITRVVAVPEAKFEQALREQALRETEEPNE